MNIGIDYDGVIMDSERALRFASEMWSTTKINKPLINPSEVSLEPRFGWTPEESQAFFTECYDDTIKDCNFMPGACEILKILSDMGHKFYLITLRGCFRKQERIITEKQIKKLPIKFEQIVWGERNKAQKCKELGLDMMIEDNPVNIELFKGSNIDVLYIQDQQIRNLKQKNVTTVYSWNDIYREVLKRSK